MNMSDVKFSRHFIETFRAKGFTPAQVQDAVEHPYKVTPVTRYPGQTRRCGRLGVAVVVAEDGVTLVTLYLDGVRTALRPDQMSDPAALASRRAL
jgi:hypothetical protein